MSDASNDQAQSPADGAVEASAASADAARSPGRQLSACRQELGWTVEHVASRLNLAPRQIEAIEADNFAALPGMASTRGFIRAYAKLLSMDAAPLVQALATETKPLDDAIALRRPLPAAPFSPVRLAPMKRGGPSRPLLLFAGLLLALAVAFAAYQSGWLKPLAAGVALRLDSTASKAPSGSESSVSSAVLAPATTLTVPPPTAAGAVAVPKASLPELSPAAVTAPIQPVPAPAPAASMTPRQDAGLSETSITSASAQAQQQDQQLLVLKAKEDCWIEIRKPDNTPMLSRTIQAGSTERIDLNGPVTVVLGNASGI
ncbi:helix-turn-helix domain-containing protein, partial [Lacisediminimonas sp.]|uniref:helix-turn-helix domain-containing protein n=1 Tax=Lacisediminimonas sp. TaxID=3060582 RepID=UPI00271F1111